jgi:hypothetical protein
VRRVLRGSVSRGGGPDFGGGGGRNYFNGIYAEAPDRQAARPGGHVFIEAVDRSFLHFSFSVQKVEFEFL